MKRMYIITIALILTSCNKHEVVKEMPIDRVKLKSMDAIEEKVITLKQRVEQIEVDRVRKDLPKLQKIGFTNRVKELKENLNKTISLIKPNYTLEEKRRLKISYAETSVIFDYLVHEYKI